MRKRTPSPAPADAKLAAMVLATLRGALAVVPHSALSACILFANYADREFFFAAVNGFEAIQ